MDVITGNECSGRDCIWDECIAVELKLVQINNFPFLIEHATDKLNLPAPAINIPNILCDNDSNVCLQMYGLLYL